MISRISISKLRSGDPGTKKTIREMIRLIRKNISNPRMILFTKRLIKENGAVTDLQRVKLIHNFLMNKILYQRDPKGVELLNDPVSILKRGFGDCDDKVILGSVLYELAGIPARISVVALKPGKKVFSHIYSQVLLNNKWIEADATIPGLKLGEQTKKPSRQLIINIKRENRNGI